mgnify:CR=1 FL=1
MKPLTDDIEEIWWKTRHGARASRGFRYQDAVTAMLMLRVWQGAFPGATVVPEGLDDVVIETPAGASLLQVKSKAPSAVAFTATKLAEFNAQMDERVTLYANAGVDVISTQLVLERSPNSSPVGEIHPNSQMYAGKQPDLVDLGPALRLHRNHCGDVRAPARSCIASCAKRCNASRRTGQCKRWQVLYGPVARGPFRYGANSSRSGPRRRC